MEIISDFSYPVGSKNIAREIIKQYKGFLFDLDGVLWAGNKVIPGAVQFINSLRNTSKRISFISNTSSRSHENTLKKMKRFGYRVKAEQLIVASRETARYLADKLCENDLVYLIGNKSLRNEIEQAGLKIVSSRDPEDNSDIEKVAYVVVGYDKNFDYKKMWLALQYFQKGAEFAAVNLDATAPSSKGLKPAGGAIAACLKALAGKEPDLMLGKPEPYLLKKGIKAMQLKPQDCIMIGDTPQSDIEAARRAGVSSALVLSGNSTKADAANLTVELKPDYVLASIENLMGAL